jgi:hypothetical protein
MRSHRSASTPAQGTVLERSRAETVASSGSAQPQLIGALATMASRSMAHAIRKLTHGKK